MVGMAPSVSGRGLVAAKKIVRKAVFCIGNVASSCNADDVRRFVEALYVRVFTCFPLRSRSHRRDEDVDDEEQATSDRHSFRLCIAADDRERLLDASKWPESVLIRPWFRISPAVAAERRAAGISSLASSQLARSVTDNKETIPNAPTTASTTSTGCTEGTSPMDNADTDCTILYHHGDAAERAAI